MSVKSDSTSSIEIRRRVAAPPAEVFDAWTDPEVFPSWIAPDGRVLMTPKVDGLYYIAMLHEGRVYPHYGRFLVMERPRRLEFTWMSESTEGNESTVALRFDPDGDGGTMVRLVHSGLPSPEMAACHEEGWTGFMEILAARFARVS